MNWELVALITMFSPSPSSLSRPLSRLSTRNREDHRLSNHRLGKLQLRLSLSFSLISPSWPPALSSSSTCHRASVPSSSSRATCRRPTPTPACASSSIWPTPLRSPSAPLLPAACAASLAGAGSGDRVEFKQGGAARVGWGHGVLHLPAWHVPPNLHLCQPSQLVVLPTSVLSHRSVDLAQRLGLARAPRGIPMRRRLPKTEAYNRGAVVWPASEKG
jgi:hypothetical protein